MKIVFSLTVVGHPQKGKGRTPFLNIMWNINMPCKWGMASMECRACNYLKETNQVAQINLRFASKKAIWLWQVWVPKVLPRMTGDLSKLSHLPQPKTEQPTTAINWTYISMMRGSRHDNQQGWEISYTIRCHSNGVNFLPNSHNRHPIAHPWGSDIGCLLQVILKCDSLPDTVITVLYIISW